MSRYKEKQMKRLWLAVAIPVIFGAPALFAAGDAAAGKDAYMKKCASCHGQAGEGKEAIAAMMKIKFAHLGSKEVQAKSDADLKKIPLEGAGKMKPVKDMDAKTAEDIVAFMRTLKQK
jgi:mono/diheme cytochrome c family protein